MLERFDMANLQLHPRKYLIAQPEVKYLGYVLCDKVVSASSDTVEAVKNYPTPRNTKKVRAFLGLALYSRRLVANFAEMAKPLTKLMRKG
jgi:hypothetical protein